MTPATSQFPEKADLFSKRESDNSPLTFGKATPFRIRIARTKNLREKTYRFIHDLYCSQGYIGKNHRQGLYLSHFDALPDTVTFTVTTTSNETVGAATLVYDSSMGLPADTLYRKELNHMRGSGKRVAEIISIGIASSLKPYQTSEILQKIFNCIFIFTCQVNPATNCIMTVAPQQSIWFKRKLLFTRKGIERVVPESNNQSVVLLSASPAILTVPDIRLNAETLYPWFFSDKQEHTIVREFRRTSRPMSNSLFHYFFREATSLWLELTERERLLVTSLRNSFRTQRDNRIRSMKMGTVLQTQLASAQNEISNPSPRQKLVVKPASTLEYRQSAYRLIHDFNVENRLCKPTLSGMYLSIFDAHPDTVTFVAHRGKDLVGTLTVALDSDMGLPSDRAHSKEMQALRAKGCSVCEITSQAISPSASEPNTIISNLYSSAYIYARHVKQATDMVLSLPAAISEFYTKNLFFKPASAEQSGEILLLRLPFSKPSTAPNNWLSITWYHLLEKDTILPDIQHACVQSICPLSYHDFSLLFMKQTEIWWDAKVKERVTVWNALCHAVQSLPKTAPAADENDFTAVGPLSHYTPADHLNLDKRTYNRVPFLGTIRYRAFSHRRDNNEGILIDIGCGGMRCCSKTPQVKGDRLVLRFIDPVSGEHIAIAGKVFWCRKRRTGQYVWGLHFQKVLNSRALLFFICKELIKSDQPDTIPQKST